MQIANPFIEARPVWPRGRSFSMNDFIGFRGEFLADAGEEAILRLTGSTLYRVKLNGEWLCYGPARGPKGFFRVDEVPLTVRKGKNCLEIDVSGSNINSYYFMDHSSFLQAEVCLGGRAVLATGKNIRAVDLNEDSASAVHPVCSRIRKCTRYSYQRMFAEAYVVRNGSAELPELDLEEQPAVRMMARCVPQPTYSMDHSYTPLKTLRRHYDAQAKIGNWHFVEKIGENGFKGFHKEELEVNTYAELFRLVRDDHGEIESTLYRGRIDNSGFITLHVNCMEPGRLFVMFGEIEAPEGGVNPLRLTTVDTVVWDIREPGDYTLEAMESYTFKYAEVFMLGGKADIQEFALREYKCPLAWNYEFQCGNEDLKNIFEAGRESFAANAVDCFTDCPSRERGGWLCDSFFIGRTSFLLTGNTFMEHFFLENFAEAEGFDNIPDGMLPMVYPADHSNNNFIPNWALWLVLQVEEYLGRSGDRALVEQFKPKFMALVRYLDTFLNSDGLLEKLPAWVFVEWSKANDFVQDVNYPSNMTYAAVLDSLARMYALPELAERAEAMRRIIRRQAWNGQWFLDHACRKEDGTLEVQAADITETCQYYAFYFKTATPESHPDLWNRLLTEFGPERVSKGLWPEIWPANAFVGNYLRLDLLSKAGLHRQMLQESVGYFKKMAELTGTLWEHDKPSASCCHGFASFIDVLLVKAIEAEKQSKQN